MSDQDFFFDDEGEQPAKSGKPAKGAPKEQTGKKSAASSPAATASFWQQDTTMAVTGLVGVIALLLGVIVGIVLPVGDTVADTGEIIPVTAPELSSEQLESGELPQGHPDVGEMTGGATDGSVEPTGGEPTQDSVEGTATE